MKVLIIYHSFHHQNTKKVAQRMAQTIDAKLVALEKSEPDLIGKYDMIGFGSGIYYMKHSEQLLTFVGKLKKRTGQKAFIFSTSGLGYNRSVHSALRTKLKTKGFDIVGEWGCRGFDTVGALKLMGGINKGRPNQKDLHQADQFICELIEKTQKPS